LVPAPVDAEIDGLRRALGDGALGRIPSHLTLVPPVNVRDDALGDALAVLRAAAARTSPLTVTLGPVRTFHPTNPVLYLEVGGPDLAGVVAVRDAVFRAPLERHLSWPFVPHVTVADDATPERIEAAVVALADFSVTLTFDRVHLLAEGEGRVWRPIADVPFAAPAVVGRGGLDLEIASSVQLDVEAQRVTVEAWAASSLETYGAHDEAAPWALTARRQGDVIGTASGAIRGDELYLARLIVRADERRTGVGSHLLAAVESLAASRGCRRLTLRTQAQGPARRLYESRGWVVYATLPRWRHGRDFVQMERLLS
jgi:2'-5' RNA ligase/ribosomal protein S18 acetylase RimI-like enzyme